MDNFDHKKNTLPGKSSNSDTYGISKFGKLIKETDNVLQKTVNCNLERSRSFKFDLDCQKVLPFQKLARGKILDNLKIGTLTLS